MTRPHKNHAGAQCPLCGKYEKSLYGPVTLDVLFSRHTCYPRRWQTYENQPDEYKARFEKT